MTVEVNGTPVDSDDQANFATSMSLMLAVMVDGVVTKLVGPDGEDYAVFVLQPDGSVQMQIVPRTGTVATLISTAGASGEVSSAPAEGALVQHSGTANDVDVLWAQGRGAVTVNVAGSGSSVTQPTLDPLYKVHVITKDAGVSSIANFGRLGAGFDHGHQVTIINATGISNTLRLDGSTSNGGIIAGAYVQATWDDTNSVWMITGGGNLGSVGLVVGAGSATNATAKAIGGGSATAAGATALGAGTASGTNSTSVRGTASGADSVAILGTAAGSRSVAIAGAKVRTAGAYGKVLNLYNNQTNQPQTAEIVLAKFGGFEEEAVLTTDGLGENSGNTLRATHFTGFMQIRFEITAFENGSLACFSRLERLVTIKSSGTVMTLVDARTIGTDIHSDAGEQTSVAFSIGGTYSDLHVTATWPPSYEMDVVAVGYITGVYA